MQRKVGEINLKKLLAAAALAMMVPLFAWQGVAGAQPRW